MPAQEPAIRIADGADAEWIASRHADLYTRDEGFDGSFGVLVRSVVADFFDRHDAERERGWVVESGRRLGSIFCVRCDDATAQLRLFLLEPEVRRLGLGRRMLATCTGFAREAGYRRMTLRTFESHRAACRLYAADGFACSEPRPVHAFGRDLVELAWTRDL